MCCSDRMENNQIMKNECDIIDPKEEDIACCYIMETIEQFRSR